MLRTKSITGYKLMATDGKVGSCVDFLFDDETWKLRYIVADTGAWFTNHKVLIPSKSLNAPNQDKRGLPVKLSKEQVQAAPTLESHAPVSQQYEMTWSSHYGLPSYWTELRSMDAPLQAHAMEVAQESSGHDENLRSFNELCGYEIEGTSPKNLGKVMGRVEDFVLDDDSWRLQYAVVETDTSWMSSRKVLVAPELLTTVGWAEKKLYVDLGGKEVRDCPSFDPTNSVHPV